MEKSLDDTIFKLDKINVLVDEINLDGRWALIK